jgi:ubiquitin C-terminal hydrolase
MEDQIENDNNWGERPDIIEDPNQNYEKGNELLDQNNLGNNIPLQNNFITSQKSIQNKNQGYSNNKNINQNPYIQIQKPTHIKENPTITIQNSPVINHYEQNQMSNNNLPPNYIHQINNNPFPITSESKVFSGEKNEQKNILNQKNVNPNFNLNYIQNKNNNNNPHNQKMNKKFYQNEPQQQSTNSKSIFDNKLNSKYMKNSDYITKKGKNNNNGNMIEYKKENILQNNNNKVYINNNAPNQNTINSNKQKVNTINDKDINVSLISDSSHNDNDLNKKNNLGCNNQNNIQNNDQIISNNIINQNNIQNNNINQNFMQNDMNNNNQKINIENQNQNMIQKAFSKNNQQNIISTNPKNINDQKNINNHNNMGDKSNHKINSLEHKNNIIPNSNNEYSFSRYTKAPKTGLKNLGDTSYLNSILQILGCFRHFSSYFLKPSNGNYFIKNVQNYKLAFVIHRLFIHFYPYPEKDKSEIYNPYYVLQTINHENIIYKTKKRRNPNDLISYILNTLHNELNEFKNNNIKNIIQNFNDIKYVPQGVKNISSSNKSMIYNQFNWYELKKIKCNECHIPIYNCNSFNIFELDILRTFNYCQRFITIKDCLQYYNSERLQNLICEKCKRKTDHTGITTIYCSPNNFIFSLDRKDLDQNLLNIQFNIEEKININNFVYNKGCLTQYQLIGIVSYSTTENKYVSFCMSPVDSQWYMYNDENVQMIQLNQIISSHNINRQYIPCLLAYKSSK